MIVSLSENVIDKISITLIKIRLKISLSQSPINQIYELIMFQLTNEKCLNLRFFSYFRSLNFPDKCTVYSIFYSCQLKSSEMESTGSTNQELRNKVAELEARLAKTEWLHEKENVQETALYIPFYGDVTELNIERTILDNVGKETLKSLTSELMDLLDTSVAIYERNGDYAYGVFNSGWCQILDASSRKLYNTD